MSEGQFNANSFDAQFGSLHTKLDNIEAKLDAKCADHDARLVSLEEKLNRQQGWIGGAVFIGGSLGAVLVAVIEWIIGQHGK